MISEMMRVTIVMIAMLESGRLVKFLEIWLLDYEKMVCWGSVILFHMEFCTQIEELSSILNCFVACLPCALMSKLFYWLNLRVI